MNPITEALEAARDAFDSSARHHFEKWQQWQAVTGDPNQPSKVAYHWVRHKEIMALTEKMRQALEYVEKNTGHVNPYDGLFLELK